ncbi:unnamed protein product [Colias eurytheme]|nr:unnamed protein product [Colias eurytheme]
MMAMLWVVLFLASSGLYTVNGLPIGPTPQAYPHDSNGIIPPWGTGGGLYALPALALVITAVGLLFGCTWCYRHNDCKPNEGTDNQLFTASATHLHDARRSQPPDSGFSEPVNNNISEDNNNGPISMREMQNIANNNAAAYIISENEERNRVRDSVVEFEPLPSGIRVLDPLERCADWFGGEDFPRSQLQYLREIGRGWFGRVVEGEVEDGPSSTTVAVKILNQNASLEDKARFLDEARMYRDISHENVLPFIAKCLTEDPWLLMFELCSMDLQQYLEMNRPKMAILNESGVPLQLMCDVSSGLAHLHSRGFLYGTLWSGTVLVRGTETVRAVLGQYSEREPAHQCTAPELERHPPVHTGASEVWSLGCVVWEVCAWGAPPPRRAAAPHLPCPYRAHLYQVMQLCWNPVPENRPTAAQVHALLNHLHTTHSRTDRDDSHFEERWQRLKPNTIPKIDEHVAIVHAPSTSTDSQFGSDPEFESAHTLPDSMSVGDTAVSRSSSIMSDREPLSVQIKSDSLNNLHGSFEDVGNIYLTHNEAAAMDCHQESSHQASPSRDNLSLECKKDYPMQTSLVKSPGIRNFQNILEMGFDSKSEENQTCEDDVDRDTIGTLSHSFERHSDSTSQYTLENITPETPIKDFIPNFNEFPTNDQNISLVNENKQSLPHDNELPNDSKLEDSDINVPKLKELCEATIPSLSNGMGNEKDCTSHDSNINVRTDTSEQTKSVDLMPSEGIDKLEEVISISETNEEQVTPLVSKDLSYVSDSKIEQSEASALSEDNKVVPVSLGNSEAFLIAEREAHQKQLCEVNINKESQSIPVTDNEGDVALDFEKTFDSNKEKELNDECLFLVLKLVLHSSNSNEKLIENNNIESEPLLEVKQTNLENVADVSELPDLVQISDSASIDTNNTLESHENLIKSQPDTPEIVQNTSREIVLSDSQLDESVEDQATVQYKSLQSVYGIVPSESTESTVYMDLSSNTNNEIFNDNNKEHITDVPYMEVSNMESIAGGSGKNESTVYLDLPNVIREMDVFLHSEKILSSRDVEVKDANEFKDENVCSSTPLGSNSSVENVIDDVPDNETLVDPAIPDYGPGVSLTKLEQKSVPESLSPFESPTKSHHTDTYDENSSVVLGPFENCTLELYKGLKSGIDFVDLPKEEILAFSSNFSEINLETPSPLRDGNFLNEVPDLLHDDMQYNDQSTSESKPVAYESPDNNTDETRLQKSVFHHRLHLILQATF